jgi:hypothetical protein
MKFYNQTDRGDKVIRDQVFAIFGNGWLLSLTAENLFT